MAQTVGKRFCTYWWDCLLVSGPHWWDCLLVNGPHWWDCLLVSGPRYDWINAFCVGTPSKEAAPQARCYPERKKATGRPPAGVEPADYLRRQTDHIIEA